MIVEKQAGPLLYLSAESIAVPHAFTTRLGGVSTGCLASLNLGTGRGDMPENVVRNFRLLADAVGFRAEDLVLSRQIHSDIVHRAVWQDRGAGLFAPGLSGCDALITDEPGLALTVFTADCTPILLWDSATGAVGAVHAGWRGTALRIAGKTVEAMSAAFGTKPADIHAAIGPNIGACHFETDADVPAALAGSLGSWTGDYVRREGDKYYPDLKAVNARVLRDTGVDSIEVSDVCTVCSCDRYWSHRVTRGQRGAQGAVIVCRKEVRT